MKTLHGSMKEMEGKKRVLEEAVDALNEEMSKVRAEGKLSFTVSMGCETDRYMNNFLYSAYVYITTLSRTLD